MVSNPTPPEHDALKRGTKMTDGSVYVDESANGELMFAIPQDLDVCITFNDAAKAVQKLNEDKALGYSDWEIPSIENLRILQKSIDEGSLKGTFNLTSDNGSGAGFVDWYWSCTEPRGDAFSAHFVRLSNGEEGWGHKGTCRLSCRPVRLVPVP